MSVLVNVFHPQLEAARVNGALASAASRVVSPVRDVCALYPNWHLDLATEQAYAEAADIWVFQHPFHWYSAPAMMKHWMDEVLSFGWAYGEGAKLEGKRWAHAITVGATESEYGAGSSRKYTVEEFLHPFERAAHFCGMEFLPPLLFYGSGIVDDQLVQTWSKQYQTWLLSL